MSVDSKANVNSLIEKERRIRDLASSITSAQEQVDDAKEELKTCKEVLANLYDQLHKVASDDCHPELPFPE